jgi:hypothetical protein
VKRNETLTTNRAGASGNCEPRQARRLEIFHPNLTAQQTNLDLPAEMTDRNGSAFDQPRVATAIVRTETQNTQRKDEEEKFFHNMVTLPPPRNYYQ